MKLHDKIAIVTGGASGIGAETVRVLSERGARVLATDVQAAKGEALAEELGSNVRFHLHDVAKQSEWDEAIEFAEAEFGHVNVLINNAGIISYDSPVQDCSEVDYRRVIDVNQIGVFLGMNRVIPSMRAAGGGSIVNISSAYGLVAGAGSIAYVASKFAVAGMTKAAALDLGCFGIRVNSVHPGLIDTPISDNAPRELLDSLQSFANSMPLGRSGRPQEMAELIAFLASDNSSYCTGSGFSADGGWTAA